MPNDINSAVGRRALADVARSCSARLYFGRRSGTRATYNVFIVGDAVPSSDELSVILTHAVADANVRGCVLSVYGGKPGAFDEHAHFRLAVRCCAVCGGDNLVCDDCRLAGRGTDAENLGAFCPVCSFDPCGAAGQS